MSYLSKSDKSFCETNNFAVQSSSFNLTNVDSSSVTTAISYLGDQLGLGFFNSFRKALFEGVIDLKNSCLFFISSELAVNDKQFQRFELSVN